MLKSIAIMTSGGDSPGMNAAARAVVRTALYEGVKVFGIYDGYKGMLEDRIVELNSQSVSDIIQRGGTFLGTARCPEFKQEETRKEALKILQSHGIEGLVIIGGDGSLTGGSLLSDLGMPIVGLPGTIDNDVWGSDYTIGADTALNTILDAINKLRDTASAHRRIIVLDHADLRCSLHRNGSGKLQIMKLFLKAVTFAFQIIGSLCIFRKTACLCFCHKLRQLR